MTRPHVGAQAFIFDKMLRTANVSPLNISYIEMHGTGTQAGDATEMRSVLDVFTKEPRGPQHPLYLGSAKANVGHAESASGVTSLIKVLLMMENDEIPPHVGIKTRINHNFPTDLKARNVNIALEPAPWTRPENGKRTVFMNNFSAAGGNTALLMEDGPASRPSDVRDCRTCLPVAVSAKSVLSLQRNLEAMANYIDNAPDLSLSALSYTTTARRTHHSFRTIVVGGDVQTVKRALKELASCTDIRKIAAQSPKVGFVFTGQGSAYAGMAQQLFESISSFQSDIRRFDAIARNQGFPPFLPMVEDRGVDFSALSPVVTQVGAACVQMALTRLWISWGITPSIVVGHSLGEYAALHAAGVLTASDVIYLTGTRAQMLEEQCSAGTHAMLAVKASLSAVTARLAGTSCEIACINGPNEIVVSGDIIDIDALANTLTALNFKCVKLEVPYAFHSAQVEPILKDFDAAAQSTYFGQPAIPFISPLLERVVGRSETLNPSYLSEACRKPVNFLGGIEAAKAAALVDEKTVWIEIGAHPVCSGMLKSIISPRISAIPSLRRYTDTWETIAESIASLHRIGLELNWNEYHRDFESFHRVLKLPSYNWDSKNHWIQYENNFCLTKGDSIVVSSAPKPQISSLSTTAVQRVVGQTIGKDCSTVLVESDLSDPILARVLQGHQVNGAPLCPSVSFAFT